jgi:hypothetical protein
MEYFRSKFHLDKKTGSNTGKNQEGEGGNGYAECIRQNTRAAKGLGKRRRPGTKGRNH